MRRKLAAVLIFTTCCVAFGSFASAWASGAQTALYVTHGWTFDNATATEISRLDSSLTSGVLGIIDYPVWGPFSVGVMSTVWHHSGKSAADEPFQLSALLSGGPSLRISPSVDSNWSLFAAVHQGIFIHYSQKDQSTQGASNLFEITHGVTHQTSRGFSIGLTLPTTQIAGLEIGAAAVYERMQFPGVKQLQPASLIETEQGLSLNRISFGIDFSFRF